MPTEYTENNKRILKNSIMLYFRTFVILVISLFTSRIVINTLGIVDYGIYNVVAGVVAMMTLLNTSMSGTIQRFLNYAEGREDIELQIKTFNSAFLVYLILCAIFVFLAETIGLWFLNNKLIIPADRMNTANWVYQFVIISSAVSFMSNPYNAVIISHERMNIYAYVSIIEASLKLLSAVLLMIIKTDKLFIYSVFMMSIAIVNTSMYRIYCKRHFVESHIIFAFDKQLFKQIFTFSGWTLFGSGSDMVKDQGGNILLNLFFTPAVNASRGVAMQINAISTQFFSNFYTAVKPQIVKYYAQKDEEHLFDLVIRSSKFSFYLIMLVAIPITFEAPFLINLWLGNVPEYAVSFFRLTILASAFSAISSPLMTTANATGKIVLYQTSIGCLKLLNLPISYIFLKLGYPPTSVFVIAASISALCLFARLLIVQYLLPSFPARQFINDVLLRVFCVATIAIIPLMILKGICNEGITSSISIIAMSIILSVLSIITLGINKNEKQHIINTVRSKITI